MRNLDRLPVLVGDEIRLTNQRTYRSQQKEDKKMAKVARSARQPLATHLKLTGFVL
jgi:hypothetical protein